MKRSTIREKRQDAPDSISFHPGYACCCRASCSSACWIKARPTPPNFPAASKNYSMGGFNSEVQLL